jgi:hypothetical protein
MPTAPPPNAIPGPAPANVGMPNVPRPAFRPIGEPGVSLLSTPAGEAPSSPAAALTPAQAHLRRMNELEDRGSGISQIHSPWARIPLQILDALGSAIVPQLTMNLPGTEYHHQMLVRGARGNVTEDEALASGEAQREHLAAETANQQAEAAARANPQATWKQGTEPEVDPEHPELGPQSVWYNEKDPTQKRFGGAPVAAKPTGPKEPKEGELPLGERVPQLNKELEARYQVLHPGQALPPQFTLAANATQKDFDRMDKVMEATEKATGTKAEQDTLAEMRRQNQATAAETKKNTEATQSYYKHSGFIDKLRAPVDTLVMRMGRLEDTLRQQSPQADALVAPELLTVMAGGQGSGLRMNEAEIARIVGGRSVWENLKARIQHWNTDPAAARSITPDQDKQIRALVGAVAAKVHGKQAAADEARRALIESNDPKEHRQIYAKMQEEFDRIDRGEEPGGGGGGTIRVQIPGHPPAEIDATRKADFLKKYPNAKVL